MVPLEAVCLNTLAQSHDRLNFFDPAGGKPYGKGDRTICGGQREQGRNREKPDFIGDSCLRDHHFVDRWERTVGKPDAGQGGDQRDPQKLEHQRKDQLPGGVADCLPCA